MPIDKLKAHSSKLKAISLWQPWASLMAMGLKKIETRNWKTTYRGPLLIHAAKKIIGWPSITIQAVFDGIAFQPSDLPLGQIICIVTLIDCKRILLHNKPSFPEREFGDYTPGRWMWITKNLYRFDEPISFKGKQGIFNVSNEIFKKPLVLMRESGGSVGRKALIATQP